MKARTLTVRAHELRSPLTAIIGLDEVLGRGCTA